MSDQAQIPPAPPEPNFWDFRHALICASLVFDWSCIAYSMIWQQDKAIAQSVLTLAFPSFLAILGGYLWAERGK